MKARNNVKNKIAAAIRSASAEDLAEFTKEMCEALGYEEDANDVIEEAVIESAECLEECAATYKDRGKWLLTSGLSSISNMENDGNGNGAPWFMVTDSYCEEAKESLSLASEVFVDLLDMPQNTVIDVSLLSSRSACDAWAHALQVNVHDGRRRMSSVCHTIEGWCVVSWVVGSDLSSEISFWDRSCPANARLLALYREKDASKVVNLINWNKAA